MVALQKGQEDDGRGLMTLEEYFRFCEQTDLRYEYLHGQIYLMAGTTGDHGIIQANFVTLLRQHLRGGSCRVYGAQTAVQVAEDVVLLPDVTVSCDERDRGATVITYPKVVVEVLSPSTEYADQTHKLLHYMECPSMQAILFVDTKLRLVTMEQRLSGKWDRWPYYSGNQLRISCLDFESPVDALYEDTEIR